MVLNINQFAPTPVVGDLDLSIMMSNTITGILSANQATSLVAGASVEFDSAITSGLVPQFVAAASSVVAFGALKRTVQAATFASLDKVEVVGNFGPVMYFLAMSTMAPGIAVQKNSSDSTIVEAVGAGKSFGILIDAASSGQIVRVMITTPVSQNS